MRTKLVCALFLAMAAAVSGCGTMAPKYARPDAPVPGAWPQGTAYPKTRSASAAPEAAGLAWRDFIRDEKLRSVVQLALENNRDLKSAAINTERARTQYGLQRSQLLPVVAAVGTQTRQSQESAVGYLSSKPGQPIVPVVQRNITERDSVNLGMAAWEIDFFGRIQSLKDAALQQYFATEQAQRAVQIMLVSQVATAYHGVAADREALRLARQTLEAQQGMFDLVKRRYEGGVASELDVQRAQTQVDAARGDVARYTQHEAQDRNALDFLAGTAVPDDLLPADLDSVALPADISAGTPSDVLLKRPDVLQAEALLKSANANIGAARAAFFPRISLTAGVATASGDLESLFDAGTGTWTWAPQAVLPIFDPRTWHGVKLSEQEKELAVAQYERAVQGAFREVADALAVSGTVEEQLAAQRSLVAATARALELSETRYTKGIDSYLSVLDAQRSLRVAEQLLVVYKLAKAANQVQLYAVLGGGWDAESSGDVNEAQAIPPTPAVQQRETRSAVDANLK